MASKRRHHILIVDDDKGQRDLLGTFLSEQGYAVAEAGSGAAALAAVGAGVPDMIITDVRMQGMSGLELMHRVREDLPVLPVLLVTAYADVRDAVEAMRDGAVSYLEKPIDFQELLDCVQEALGDAAAASAMTAAVPDLPAETVADSLAMQAVLQEAALVARSESRVLLTGESGTGKEVVADLIHTWSPRRHEPMVKVNCAAIPENLLESELFGHEKGAFTGAHRQRLGRFEDAHRGTLFLDEIGDMSPALQAKLLRVIQNGIIERVGAQDPITVNVRIVAATNRNLEQDVKQGRFREDLFYRLTVIEICLPPLRARPADIMPLAELFAARFADDKPRFSGATVTVLSLYPWPGNVRELQNAMERATLMARGGMILPEHLPRRIRDTAAGSDPAAAAAAASGGRMEQMERTLILQTLKEHAYNRTASARALGISRRALTYKLRDLKDLGYTISE